MMAYFLTRLPFDLAKYPLIFSDRGLFIVTFQQIWEKLDEGHYSTGTAELEI